MIYNNTDLKISILSEMVDSEMHNFNTLLESLNVLNENNILLEADKESIFSKIGAKIKAIIEKIKGFIKGIISKIKGVISSIVFSVKLGKGLHDLGKAFEDMDLDDFDIDWDESDFEFSSDFSEAISINTLKSNIEKMASNPYVFAKYSDYIKIKSIPDIVSKFVKAGLSDDNLSTSKLEEIETLYNSCIEDIMGKFSFTKASNVYSSSVVGSVTNELYKRIHNQYGHRSYTYDQLVYTIRTNLEDNKKSLDVLVNSEQRLYKVLDDIPEDMNNAIKNNANNPTAVGNYYSKFLFLINSFNHVISALSKSVIASVSKASAIIRYINNNEKIEQ